MTTSNTIPTDSARERLVVVYLRVSSDKQDLDRQRAQIERAKSDNHDAEILVLEDDGVSAFKNSIFDRPESGKLCRLIEEGKVAKVYTDAQDRLSRGDELEWVTFRALAASHNTALIIDGRELRSDLGGRLEGFLNALRAHGESEDKSHRVSTAKAAQARRGLWHHGPLPPGPRREDDGTITKTRDLGAIIEAFRRFADQNASYPQLRTFLTDALGEATFRGQKVRLDPDDDLIYGTTIRGW